MTTFSSIGLGRSINAGVNMLIPSDMQISVITANGAVFIYLPSISSLLSSRASSGNLQYIQFIISDISGMAATNNITVFAANGETINGAASVVLNINYISALLVPTSNTSWGSITTISTGGGGSGVYNGASPSTVTVNGIPAGTTLTGLTFEYLLQNIYAPYQAPAFTSFTISGQSTLIEVGTVLSGMKNFLWATSNSGNVQPNSINIRDVNANVLIATGLANDGAENVNIGSIVNSSPISQSWRGEGVNTQLGTFMSSNFTVNSIYPVFYGKVASGGAPSGGNRPVANQALINSGTVAVVNSNGTITISFDTTSDDYMWFAVPSTSTLKTQWYVDTLNNGSIGGAVSPSGNLFPAPDTVVIDSPTVLWSGVSYKIYIANYQSGIVVPMELRN